MTHEETLRYCDACSWVNVEKLTSLDLVATEYLLNKHFLSRMND